MEICRTAKYLKSLTKIPMRNRDAIEAAVDRLETDLSGVIRIEGTHRVARLDVGEYRVFLTRREGKPPGLIIEEAVRRTTTTYRKRN